MNLKFKVSISGCISKCFIIPSMNFCTFTTKSLTTSKYPWLIASRSALSSSAWTLHILQYQEFNCLTTSIQFRSPRSVKSLLNELLCKRTNECISICLTLHQLNTLYLVRFDESVDLDITVVMIVFALIHQVVKECQRCYITISV